MKITTIVDNIVYDGKLVAEHGFSIYLNDDNYKVLFDTGQTDILINNAEILKVDLSDIDAVVISHGHYDHTGGLQAFCKVNSKAKIYIKPQALLEKYNGTDKYIGIPFNTELIKDRFVFVEIDVHLTNNIVIVSNIKISKAKDTHFKKMLIKNDNLFCSDTFEDELFIAVKNENGLVVITGCSHRGITNIAETTEELFSMPISYMIGGFHLKNEKITKVIEVIELLNTKNVDTIVLAHCTGVEMFKVITETFKGKVIYNFIGNKLVI